MGRPPKPPKPPKPKSKLGALTFSLMLLVTGAIALLDLAGADVPAAVYVAALLATVGVGLLIGAWYGRARGLIALGIIGVFTLSGVAGVDRWNDDGWHGGGTVVWTPKSVDEINGHYSHDLGDATLDLSNVDFTGHDVNIDVDTSLGSLRILLPETVDAEVNADVQLGNAQIFDSQWSGLDPGRRTVKDLGPDGTGGGTIVISAKVDLGNLEVQR
jgi:hypothetical protein